MDPELEKKIKNEIIEKFDWNEDDNADEIDKVFGIEKEKYQAIQSKKGARKDLELMTKGKEWYKDKAQQPDKANKPDKADNPEKETISSHDKAYLYAQGYTRTEVRYLEKVMRLSKEPIPWEKAMKDNLFQTWKKDNDTLITRRGSVLPASRGGMSGKAKTDHDKMVDKFSKDLPKGFSAKPPKED